MNYDEVIKRIGYFRTQANLSARETSQRLGFNPQFLSTIETKKVELKVSTLLDFCEVVGITIEDFFYLGEKYNSEQKEILQLFKSLTDEKKDMIINLLKTLK